MSKIEEMALSYGREHQGTVDIEVFEAGANAVLKDIEDLTCLSAEALKIYLPRKIKELKGE